MFVDLRGGIIDCRGGIREFLFCRNPKQTPTLSALDPSKVLILLRKIHTLGGQLRIRWGAGEGSKKEVQKSNICIREGYDGTVECLKTHMK